MRVRLLSLVLVMVGFVTPTVLGFPPGVFRATTRPRALSGIPKSTKADYQAQQFRSRTVTAISLPATMALEDEASRLQRIIGDASPVQQILDRVTKVPAAIGAARTSTARLSQIANLPGEVDTAAVEAALSRAEVSSSEVESIVSDAQGIVSESVAAFTEATTPSGSGTPPPAAEGAPSLQPAATSSQPNVPADVSTDDATPDSAPPPTGSEPTENGAKQERTKFFQLRQTRLQIDHCSISRFALQLQEDGNWILSLRADQNPRGQQGLFGRAPAYNPQLHIKRNEFVVSIRFYGAFRTFRRRLDQVAGKPVIAEIGPVEFIVENGQPMYLSMSNTDESQTKGKKLGQIELTAEQFELIDRVEVEFYYQ